MEMLAKSISTSEILHSAEQSMSSWRQDLMSEGEYLKIFQGSEQNSVSTQPLLDADEDDYWERAIKGILGVYHRNLPPPMVAPAPVNEPPPQPVVVPHVDTSGDSDSYYYYSDVWDTLPLDPSEYMFDG
jgi:hypothetical protein